MIRPPGRAPRSTILFVARTVNHLLVIVVSTVFLFSLLFNLGIDPYIALLADVTPSEQRGTVNGIAAGLGYAGQIALGVLAFILIEAHPDWLFYIVAVALVVGFGIVALVIREKRELIHVEHKRVRRPSIIFNPLLRFLVIPVVTGPLLGQESFSILPRYGGISMKPPNCSPSNFSTSSVSTRPRRS